MLLQGAGEIAAGYNAPILGPNFHHYRGLTPNITTKPANVIIFRYLAKEVLTSMVAVSAVLLLIIMSGRFVRYLADAAAGKQNPG